MFDRCKPDFVRVENIDNKGTNLLLKLIVHYSLNAEIELWNLKIGTEFLELFVASAEQSHGQRAGDHLGNVVEMGKESIFDLRL